MGVACFRVLGIVSLTSSKGVASHLPCLRLRQNAKCVLTCIACEVGKVGSWLSTRIACEKGCVYTNAMLAKLICIYASTTCHFTKNKKGYLPAGSVPTKNSLVSFQIMTDFLFFLLLRLLIFFCGFRCAFRHIPARAISLV